MASYLASPRADYLKWSLVSIKWDLEETEAREEDTEKATLKLKWVAVLR